MLSFLKIIFIVIGGIFLVSYLQDSGFSMNTSGNTNSSSELSDRDAYARSYDSNNDGVVSDNEYQQGEYARVEEELETLEEELAQALEDANASPYRDMVTLSTGNAYATDRGEEYVVLYTNGSNETPINITGWYLKSLLTKRGGTIGEGVRVIQSRQPWFSKDDIYLAPGDRAYVSSGGAAGIGTSFLTNICTGYLDTNQRFTPSLPQECPLLEDEDLARFDLAYNDFDDEDDYDACMDAIETIYSCEREQPDRNLTDECKDFIREYATYDGCVDLHKNDSDFLGNEWRIFLGSSRNELWRSEREAIGLFDREGRVVDVVRY